MKPITKENNETRFGPTKFDERVLTTIGLFAIIIIAITIIDVVGHGLGIGCLFKAVGIL